MASNTSTSVDIFVKLGYAGNAATNSAMIVPLTAVLLPSTDHRRAFPKSSSGPDALLHIVVQLSQPRPGETTECCAIPRITLQNTFIIRCIKGPILAAVQRSALRTWVN